MKKIILTMVFIGSLGGLINNAFAGYFSNNPMPVCDSVISQNLAFGDSGEEVYSLQEMLYRGGYLNVTPNGYFGYATQTAVKSFQRDNNLEVVGYIGSKTRDAVNERMCDADPRGDSLKYNYYSGYNSGVTYVDPYDPYVKVIKPKVDNPAVYTTPQDGVKASPTVYSDVNASNSVERNYPSLPGVVNNNLSDLNNFNLSNQTYFSNNYSPITPATVDTNVTNAQIKYNQSVGYYYGVTPNSGSVTITSPLANVIYSEGDTVNLNWYTNNINASQFQVILENTTTAKSQVINTVSANTNSFSFVLTKSLLDNVCGVAGTCNANSESSYRIVLATPYVDISGKISTFKAAISPVRIKRTYVELSNSSMTVSKSPVNSEEMFKIYVNIPAGGSSSNYVGQYSFKISAVCPSGVTVSIGGLDCGEEFYMPQAPLYYQQQVPVMALNSGWFAQNVTFNMTVFNTAGQVISTSSATAVVNPIPRTAF